MDGRPGWPINGQLPESSRRDDHDREVRTARRAPHLLSLCIGQCACSQLADAIVASLAAGELASKIAAMEAGPRRRARALPAGFEEPAIMPIEAEVPHVVPPPRPQVQIEFRVPAFACALDAREPTRTVAAPRVAGVRDARCGRHPAVRPADSGQR